MPTQLKGNLNKNRSYMHKFSFTDRIISSFRKLPVCTNATVTFDSVLSSLGITNRWLKSYHADVLNVYSLIETELLRRSLQSWVYPAAERIQCFCFPQYGACFTILDARHRGALCEHPAAPVNLLVMDEMHPEWSPRGPTRNWSHPPTGQ